MDNTENTQMSSSQLLIFQGDDGKLRVEARLEEETVWLTQRGMAELFGCTPENILVHIKNIFQDGELQQEATTKDFLVVRLEGGRSINRRIIHYNLDAIISVGYRVNSRRATQFRQWATKVLTPLKTKVLGYLPFKSSQMSGIGWLLDVLTS